MAKRIIECVPNFSEGRDRNIIGAITAAIEAAGAVKLLDVDPGEATNRTVVTFVGEPEAVVEAAFAGVRRAAELIDMRRHKGAHPRMGATDVLPLIPISGITLEECAVLARRLAERIAAELAIPTYCYQAAASAAPANTRPCPKSSPTRRRRPTSAPAPTTKGSRARAPRRSGPAIF